MRATRIHSLRLVRYVSDGHSMSNHSHRFHTVPFFRHVPKVLGGLEFLRAADRVRN